MSNIPTHTCNGKEVSSFLGVVDTYMRWRHFTQRNDRKYEYYHPSELGKCLRAQQYKHFVECGYLEAAYASLDSVLLRLFDKGHNMHSRWASYFENVGILKGLWQCKNMSCYFFNDEGNLKKLSEDKRHKLIKDNKTRIYGRGKRTGVFKPKRCVCGSTQFNYIETPVESEELRIKGHADLILDYSNFSSDMFDGIDVSFNAKFLPKKGDEVVVDMKTIGQKAWDYQLEKRGAHKHNIIQLVTYIHVLDCNYGLLVYENKNDSEIRCYKIERNDSWWDVIKWQVKKLQSLAETKKLPPPRPKSKSDYECRSCEFSSLCHKSVIWKDPSLEAKRKKFYKGL